MDCIGCVMQNCPDSLECIQNPDCMGGLICTFTNCMDGGMPDFFCALECFDGDWEAVLQALAVFQCVLGPCADECGGLLPG